MSFRIGVIGAGWYGCHIGSSLAALGFDVTIFDRNERVLDQASGNNQFRLHLGFHYARHHGTRLQSRDGFQRFIERYPTLSAPVADNIYAVPKHTSLIDFDTYKLIMAASGIDFIEQPSGHPLLVEVDGAIKTRERVILLERARGFFSAQLQKTLKLGTDITTVHNGENYVDLNGQRFDYAIDATWGGLVQPLINVYYEPTLLLYYGTDSNHPAFTFVDGPLCSVYPTEDPEIYTLSSVTHTPLGRYNTIEDARQRIAHVEQHVIAEKKRAMEQQISVNVPTFCDTFKYLGAQISIKTKPFGNVDDRSCYVNQIGRIFSVMSGKIDTIFFATERILSLIEAERELPLPQSYSSTLKSSMRRDVGDWEGGHAR